MYGKHRSGWRKKSRVLMLATVTSESGHPQAKIYIIIICLRMESRNCRHVCVWRASRGVISQQPQLQGLAQNTRLGCSNGRNGTATSAMARRGRCLRVLLRLQRPLGNTQRTGALPWATSMSGPRAQINVPAAAKALCQRHHRKDACGRTAIPTTPRIPLRLIIKQD